MNKCKTKKERQTTKQKNIAGQFLTYNSKNFHRLNRKLDIEQTMNGLGKPFRKKSNPKNWKNSKNQSEIAACEQKTTSEKANFCSNTVFSLYFKFRAKKIHAAKPLAFSLHFLFRRDQNHYSNLTLEIMKMCEQILKKRQRPNTIQILWIVKNQEHRNIASLSLQLRSYKKDSAPIKFKFFEL